MPLAVASNAELKASRTWRAFDQLVISLSARYTELAQRLLNTDAKLAAEGFEESGEVGMLANIQTGPWIAYLVRLWLNVTKAGGEFTAEDLKADPPIPDSVYERSALDWLEDNAKPHAAGIVNTTQDTGRRAVAAGRESGASSSGIAAMIHATIRESAPARAVRIGQTETHSSANHGSLTAASQNDPAAYKIWIATPDNRTRDQHREAHNQRVRITEPFIVGGEKLMYPGHWSLGASGWNIYNCRCAMRYIVQRRGH